MTRQSINLAYICNDLGIPVFGTAGSSVHLRSLLKHLHRQGVDVTAYYQTPGGSETSDSIDWRQIRQYPFQRSSVSQFLGISDLLKNVGLRRNLLSENDRYDLIHERYSLHSLGGQHYAHKHGIPYVLEINAPLVHERSLTGDLTWRRLAKRSEQQIVSNATEVVVVSAELKQMYADFVEPENIHVVPNGVDTDKFNPDRFTPSPEDRFTLGFVGSFKEWHGVDRLIDAADKLHNLNGEIQFLLVGDGPLLNDLRQKVRARGLNEMIDFTGSVPHEEVPQYLARFDIGVAPYPDLSPFYYSPLKVFEYMSMGKPTIGSDIGQVGSVLDDETGFLFPPDDDVALVEQIKRAYNLFMSHREKFRDIGESARKRAVSRYSWQRNAERVIEVYHEAINEY